MKQSVNFYSFRDAFKSLRPNNFSYEGLSVLWDYLEQYEEDTGSEVELDVIALCCDFVEDTVEMIAASYNIDLSDCKDDEEKEQVVADYLTDEGVYVGHAAGGFVYRNF
jgi:predicted ArsR family transcriptional regulator